MFTAIMKNTHNETLIIGVRTQPFRVWKHLAFVSSGSKEVFHFPLKYSAFVITTLVSVVILPKKYDISAVEEKGKTPIQECQTVKNTLYRCCKEMFFSRAADG
ncbi:hypothetical protein NQ317_007003 [Molorchus minor]|uniref:Uncharacterized protein n=1 Tax=Molorchus minor TaxID=1323400 RepID=A0ABQ9JU83_9CUCU|nr:hypothetical protein NQ317_007003 [Molorchus minor]